MQSIRRLYLYTVTFVSLEVVLWGGIGLARSMLSANEIGGGANRLAEGLSLLLVGIPVFLLHWRLAQRSAYQDADERSSRLRAIFLYGTLLATLVPVVQNTLALVNRLLIGIFGLSPGQAMLGSNQTTGDNLIAIAANALAATYFLLIVHADWQAVPSGDEFAEVRRVFRYLWLIYSLVLLVLGGQQVLQFILTGPLSLGDGATFLLVTGFTLLLVGLPVWLLVEQLIHFSLAQAAERHSLLRLATLYILVFSSAGGVLISAGRALNLTLEVVLGARPALAEFLGQFAGPLSIAIPLGVVWAYYGRMLSREIMVPVEPTRPLEVSNRPDADQTHGQVGVWLRRAGLRRLYYYVLALFGLAAAFAGLQMLLAFILDNVLNAGALGQPVLRDQLAVALSTLAVGLPLWVWTWRPMLKEAAREGEAGDHARRSLVRKGYLFLILFVGVMGVMFSSGMLLFQLIRALLGDAQENLALEGLQQLKILLLFGLLLAYHWQTLRADGRLASRGLARRHVLFPVLVLAPDDGELSTDKGFAAIVVQALQREAPTLPVAVHAYSLGVPDETLSNARAVILPGELMAKPSEALRLWLQAFTGPRVVIPTPSNGWHWVYGERSLAALARRAAQTVRQLAEGDELPSARENSPFLLLVYILAGLFVLQIVLAVLGITASLFLR